MKPDVCEVAIDGLKLINTTLHRDTRGWFQESYRAEWDRELRLVSPFIQENHVLNEARGVVRGLHFQFPEPQSKLIRVVEGAITDVAVDIRRGSPTFGQHLAVELSSENRMQLFIPPGFAHGYATLTDRTQVLYKVNAYYNPASDRGLAWDDPALAINWRLAGPPILSNKDRCWPRLGELLTPF